MRGLTAAGNNRSAASHDVGGEVPSTEHEWPMRATAQDGAHL